MLRSLLDELKLIFRTYTVISVMVAGPIAYALMFGGVYSLGRVRQAPIMVVDQDHSALSRNLTTLIRASDSLHVVAEGASPADFEPEVAVGHVLACVTIEHDFESRIRAGRQARVLIAVDGGNTICANVILKAVRSVMGTFRVGIRAKRLAAGGVPSAIALPTAQPVAAEFRTVFNPAGNYGVFMLVGLMCIALQQCTMMGAVGSLSVSRRSAPYGPFAEILGRTAAHLCVMLPVSAVALAMPFVLFGGSFHGDWVLLAIACVAATTVNIWSGFGLLGVAKKPLLAVQLLLCASVPIFLITGYTFPTIAIPPLFQSIGNILPLTHYWHVARAVAMIGPSVDAVRPDVIAIAAWLPVTFPWALWAVCASRKRAE